MTPLDFRKLFYSMPDKYPLLGANGMVLNSHAATLPGRRNRVEVTRHTFFEGWPPNSVVEDEIMRQHEQVRHTHQLHPMSPSRYDMPSATEPTRYEQRYWETTCSPAVSDSGEVRYILQRTQMANIAPWFLLTT